jgi:molybdopterin/thiamine biosynthesis adenylyltransferase
MRPRRINPVALTNRQIERYSRQIIVDKFGGVAQERLLTSRVLLVSADPGADALLAYLVGAGIGNLVLRSNLDPAASVSIVTRMRDLNSDCTVVVDDNVGPANTDFDLALVIVNDTATLDHGRALCDENGNLAQHSAVVFARIDQPARIAVIPQRPPCPRCADIGDLLAPIGARVGDAAGFVAMLAALEAIKLIARHDPSPKPTLIEFHGYGSSTRTIDSMAKCSCSRPAPVRT